MTHPTLSGFSASGVNSHAMDDETRIAHEADETAIVASDAPTMAPDLAWSDYEEEYPDSGTIVLARAMPAVRWITVVTAVLLAGVTAVWFGIVLYRDEKPAAPAPTHAPTPTALAPPTPKTITPPPAPIDPPHPAAQYPWVAIAVSPVHGQQINIGTGYGFNQAQALRSSVAACTGSCSGVASAINGCVAFVVARAGAYTTAVGSTRSEALAAAKVQIPNTTAAEAYCSWDGNGAEPVPAN